MKGKPKAPGRKRPEFQEPSPPAFSGFGPKLPPQPPAAPFATTGHAAARSASTPPTSMTPEREPLGAEGAICLHKHLLPAAVFARATESLRLKASVAALGAYLLNVVDDMKPRDAFERMLIQHASLTHARVMRLTDLATVATTLDGIRILNELVDRASNTYRRQMLALADYRRPHAVPAPVTLPNTSTNTTINAIEQINIAGQQVIQNHVQAKPENATNEQGCREPSTSQPPPTPGSGAPARSPAVEGSQPEFERPPIYAAALQADTGRASFPSFERPAGEAVGAVNRAANG